MKKNILISTGGSGGHVIPATIFYEHLKNEFNVFITSDHRGTKFLNKSKYDIKIINTPKISKNIFLLPFQIYSLITLILKSYYFLKDKKIEILISTGGFMTVPLCIAAKILNIKIFLFEPNMVLGRSNKIFVKSCEKVFCYSDKIKKFPKKLKDKVAIIPALLRKKFYHKRIIEDIGKDINLLIIGGSQGAKLFDNIINESIVELSKRYKLKIFQQTSFENHEYLKNFYLKRNIENELFDFNEDIYDFMIKSNLAITRAGASTLAELNFLNIPHIAIPLPSAKDNHQFENAFFYEQNDCNWVMRQIEISNDFLVNKLINIIDNKQEYLNKKKNMKNFNYQNTWNNINQKIIKIINEN